MDEQRLSLSSRGSLWALSSDFPPVCGVSLSTAAQKGGPSSTLSLHGQRTKFLEENGAVTFAGVHQDGPSPLHPFLDQGSGPGEDLSLQATTLMPQSLGQPLPTLCWPPGPCYPAPTSEPCRLFVPSRSYSDEFHLTGPHSRQRLI